MKKLNSYYDCISYNFSKETIQLFVPILIAIFLKRNIRYIVLVYKRMTEAFLYAKKTLDLSQLTLQIILFGFIYLYTNNIQLLSFMDSYKHYYVFRCFKNVSNLIICGDFINLKEYPFMLNKMKIKMNFQMISLLLF